MFLYEKPPTPKPELRPTAGNKLYKSIKDGNMWVEVQADAPKYYNNNYPIQSIATNGETYIKGTYYRKLKLKCEKT